MTYQPLKMVTRGGQSDVALDWMHSALYAINVGPTSDRQL